MAAIGFECEFELIAQKLNCLKLNYFIVFPVLSEVIIT